MKLLPSLTAFMIFVTSAACAADPADKTLAVVNGQDVTQRVLDLYRNQDTGTLLLPPGPRTLANFMDVLLLAQEAERRGLDRDPVTRARLRNVRVDVATTFLEQVGLTWADGPARAAYPQLAADPAYQLVRLRMMMAPTQAEANDLAAQLAAGATFQALAPAHLPSPCALLTDLPGRIGGSLPCVDKDGELGFGRFAPTVDAGPFPDVATWPSTIQSAVEGVATGGVTAPVEVDGRWLLLQVEDRRPISPDEILPALRRSIMQEQMRAIRANLAVPFTPAASVGDDLVVGHIGQEPITAYDIFVQSEDGQRNFRPWQILDPMEARFWATPQPADSPEAIELARSMGLLTTVERAGAMATPEMQARLLVLRSVVLADALGWRLVNDALDSGTLAGEATTEILARTYATDTQDHAAILAAGLRAGHDPMTLGIPVDTCRTEAELCGRDGTALYLVPQPPGADTDPILRVLTTLPIGTVSNAVAVPPPVPQTDAKAPDWMQDDMVLEPQIKHGFDVGIVLARRQRRMLDDPDHEFDKGIAAESDLLSRLRTKTSILIP